MKLADAISRRHAERGTAQFLLESGMPECIRSRIACFPGIGLAAHALPRRRRFALFAAAIRLVAQRGAEFRARDLRRRRAGRRVVGRFPRPDRRREEVSDRKSVV